jgi:hypothetical protein
MLSGLHRVPVVKVEVVPLVRFWGSGLNAYRTNMTYAVETAMSGRQLFNVGNAQRLLLRHLYNEVTAFRKFGWRAHPVFKKRRALTEDEHWIVSQFRHDLLNREHNSLNEQIRLTDVDGDYGRFGRYARDSFRLFPSLKEIFGELRIKYSLAASKKKLEIMNNVEGAKQFANAGVYEKAKAMFENILDHIIRHAKEGCIIEIYLNGENLYFEINNDGLDTRSFESDRTGAREMSDDEIMWKSIWESESKLGWKVTMNNKSQVGTRIRVVMTDDSFASEQVITKRRVTTQSIRKVQASASHKELVESARIFVGAQPFQGYKVRGRTLNLSGSPIYEAIQFSRELIGPLEVSIGRSGSPIFDTGISLK